MAAIDWELSVDENLWDQLMTRDIESLLHRAGSSAEHQPDPIIIAGTGCAEINARKPREIDLHVVTSTGVSLVVPQFYYPYWTAQLSGEPNSLTLSPSEPDGLLSLWVPPGDHEIQLRLKRSGAELWGQIISLVSLMVALSLVLYLRLFQNADGFPSNRARTATR